MAEYLEQNYGVRGDAGAGGERTSTALEGLRVLELGAGIGFVSQVLWDLGADVVATDKANMLPLLRESMPISTGPSA